MHSTLIDVATLISLIDDADPPEAALVIVDCRFSLANTEQGERGYREAHIPGARYAHLDNDLSGTLVPGVTGRHPLPERDKLTAQFRQWGISNNTQIIAYDDLNGAFASRLWWLSRWLGHEACAVLDGGMTAWEAAGGTTESVVPEASGDTGGRASLSTDTGTFTASAARVDIVDIDTVNSTGVLSVDARDPERFAGRVEPVDPVAGHIPGAANMPFSANLQENGRFLPADQLRARFEPLAVKAAGRPQVHYCGSGVTAAHNLLAMAHAGMAVPALYPGSWSEWITRDAEQYPVATRDD